MSRFGRHRSSKQRGSTEPVRSPTGTVLKAIDADMEGMMSDFDALPHMPTVLASIQSALQSGRSDAQHVAKLVGSDVALTAQILRVVNSAYYGLSRPILDLRYAVAYLGFSEVYRIVLTVAVVQGLEIEDQEGVERFWHHSFYAAIVAKYVAGLYDRLVDPGELWPAALLHDVGQLVYLKLYPKHFAAIEEHRTTHSCTLAEAENALGLPSHTSLGAMLCQKWHLPETLADVCEYHELKDPERAAGSDTAIAFRRLVAASSILAELAEGQLSPEAREQQGRQVRKLLKITSTEFIRLMASVYDMRADAEEFAKSVT
jgi:two-component system cell cycle response regulator